MCDKGWDVFLQETLDLFPGRLGVVSPFHNCGLHVDQPFVSREWVELVGWYACPDFKHYAWPLVAGIIGGQTGILLQPQGEFSIQHDYVGGYWEEVYVADCKALYSCIASTVIHKVDVIQRAMRGAEQIPKAIPRTMGVNYEHRQGIDHLPSRDRPGPLKRLIRSFLKTSTHAKLVVVIDEDQKRPVRPARLGRSG